MCLSLMYVNDNRWLVICSPRNAHRRLLCLTLILSYFCEATRTLWLAFKHNSLVWFALEFPRQDRRIIPLATNFQVPTRTRTLSKTIRSLNHKNVTPDFDLIGSQVGSWGFSASSVMGLLVSESLAARRKSRSATNTLSTASEFYARNSATQPTP